MAHMIEDCLLNSPLRRCHVEQAIYDRTRHKCFTGTSRYTRSPYLGRVVCIVMSTHLLLKATTFIAPGGMGVVPLQVFI
ncbi:hypothetical protein AXF42_Ash018215 [Apostasia shenzhenica]|uniref:Uncharacterized protein n=1 Tax=Apostasia shenzhenica TaxID=1088818 RepID=A0A2I0B1D5_9ASPA|nr:hypothetical protein AXF42_Ash018215 [Apostasia shenzhenica]